MILRSVALDGIRGQRIDFLFALFPEKACSKSHGFRNRYVDEVQDNLLIDAKSNKFSCHYLHRLTFKLTFRTVLRAICRNPDGQFWAGDTAQTISVGSSFRFDDLKAFLHRNEASFLHNFGLAPLKLYLSATGKSETAICWNDYIPFTKVFPTCHKFSLARRDSKVRSLDHSSHYEILALCNRYLAPRERNCRRNQACFLQRLGPGQCAIRIFPLRNSVSASCSFIQCFLSQFKSGQHIEFGAQQCILVRSDAAREKLRAQVGDVGLIMCVFSSYIIHHDANHFL